MFDRTRYDHVQRIIDTSTNKLLGTSMTEATRLLSLENIKWDEGYTSVPHGQLRMYRFRGFYLLLSVQLFPRKVAPGSPEPFSESELRSNGVWRVANFYPALHIDGITDPQLRISNYWAQLHIGFAERTTLLTANSTNQQQWMDFAWSTNGSDLKLLQKNLEAQGVRCTAARTNFNSDFIPLRVDSRDFTHARTVATNCIIRNLLSIQIGTDHGWGHELWENGKKISEIYF